VTSQKERVAEINNQLDKISKDAIQKQAAGEVPVQPTPRDSEALAQGEPQPKPEVITTEGIQEDTEKEVKTIAQKLSELPLEYGFSKIGDMFISGNESAIAQMYVEAKANNTNPEIVEKVESIIGTPQQEKITPIDFSTQLEQKYGVKVDLSGRLDKGSLTLSRIVIPEEQRGTGIGTQVM
ncbi:MAG: hypothetical protein ACK45Z_11425, partial [Dolichospermum sp.]